MNYSGTILFLTGDKTKAIVAEGVVGDSFRSKLAFVEANLSAKSVGDTITYSYDQTFGSNNGYNITVI